MTNLSNPPEGCRVPRDPGKTLSEWLSDDHETVSPVQHCIESYRATNAGTHPSINYRVNYQELFEAYFALHWEMKQSESHFRNRYNAACTDTERLRVGRDAFRDDPRGRVWLYHQLTEHLGHQDQLILIPGDSSCLIVSAEVLPAKRWKACEIVAWVYTTTPQAVRKYLARHRSDPDMPRIRLPSNRPRRSPRIS